MPRPGQYGKPNWAFERGTYEITVAPRTGGSPISDAGKYITIYHRQADGTWVMARDIWNSSNQLQGLSQAHVLAAGTQGAP